MRDIWDNSNIYWFWDLSVDKLKYKLIHRPKKDLRIKRTLTEVLEWKIGGKKMYENDLRECEVCGKRTKLYFNEYTEQWVCETCLNIDLDSRGD